VPELIQLEVNLLLEVHPIGVGLQLVGSLSGMARMMVNYRCVLPRRAGGRMGPEA